MPRNSLRGRKRNSRTKRNSLRKIKRRSSKRYNKKGGNMFSDAWKHKGLTRVSEDRFIEWMEQNPGRENDVLVEGEEGKEKYFIPSIMGRFARGVKNSPKNIKNWGKQAFTDLKEGKAWEKIKSDARSFRKSVTGKLGALRDTLKSNLKKMMEGFTNLYTKADKKLQKVEDDFQKEKAQLTSTLNRMAHLVGCMDKTITGKSGDGTVGGHDIVEALQKNNSKLYSKIKKFLQWKGTGKEEYSAKTKHSAFDGFIKDTVTKIYDCTNNNDSEADKDVLKTLEDVKKELVELQKAAEGEAIDKAAAAKTRREEMELEIDQLNIDDLVESNKITQETKKANLLQELTKKKAETAKAQEAVDKAQDKLNNAPDNEKAKADEELKKAQEKLSKAKEEQSKVDTELMKFGNKKVGEKLDKDAEAIADDEQTKKAKEDLEAKKGKLEKKKEELSNEATTMKTEFNKMLDAHIGKIETAHKLSKDVEEYKKQRKAEAVKLGKLYKNILNNPDKKPTAQQKTDMKKLAEDYHKFDIQIVEAMKKIQEVMEPVMEKIGDDGVKAAAENAGDNTPKQNETIEKIAKLEETVETADAKRVNPDATEGEKKATVIEEAQNMSDDEKTGHAVAEAAGQNKSSATSLLSSLASGVMDRVYGFLGSSSNDESDTDTTPAQGSTATAQGSTATAQGSTATAAQQPAQAGGSRWKGSIHAESMNQLRFYYNLRKYQYGGAGDSTTSAEPETVVTEETTPKEGDHKTAINLRKKIVRLLEQLENKIKEKITTSMKKILDTLKTKHEELSEDDKKVVDVSMYEEITERIGQDLIKSSIFMTHIQLGKVLENYRKASILTDIKRHVSEANLQLHKLVYGIKTKNWKAKYNIYKEKSKKMVEKFLGASKEKLDEVQEQTRKAAAENIDLNDANLDDKQGENQAGGSKTFNQTLNELIKLNKKMIKDYKQYGGLMKKNKRSLNKSRKRSQKSRKRRR